MERYSGIMTISIKLFFLLVITKNHFGIFLQLDLLLRFYFQWYNVKICDTNSKYLHFEGVVEVK